MAENRRRKNRRIVPKHAAQKETRRDMRIHSPQALPPQQRRETKETTELELPSLPPKQSKPADASASRRRRGRKVEEKPELDLPDFPQKKSKPAEALPDPAEQAVKARGRKKRAWLLRMLLAVVGVMLLATLAYLFLRVEEVTVQGVQWTDPAVVTELSGIRQGDSILLLNTAAVKRQIESDPHFIYRKLQYRFPTGITIVVEERQEAACFAFANTFVTVDAEGLILGHREQFEGRSLPLVEGLEVTEFVLGAEIRTTDTYKQDILRRLLAALCDSEVHAQVDTIDLANVNQLWMRLADGTRVCLGQGAQFAEKLQWLAQILPKIHEEGYSGGTVDLTSVLAPVYVPEQQSADAQQ